MSFLRLGASLVAQIVKSVCLQCGRSGFDPWVGKIPWRRKWQPTPVLLPGKSHVWRSLVGYSPWGCKELDKIEQLHFHFSLDWGFPCGSAGKKIHLQCGRPGFNPWFGNNTWRREKLPTPVFWPRDLYGLYSPWDHKESNTTEQLSLHFLKLSMCFE